jgi:hypothetical protein
MRITDFPELVLPLGTDVLVGVDVVNDITKKIKLENLPVSIPTTAALNAKQNVLVSGTTIKTLNSISLLGSGDIVLTANASGVAGAVQFSNGSAFSSDASNLFWDNTDKRLGVGTNITTVGNATLDQVTQRIYVNGSFSQIAHYIGSTANGISGDTSLALFGLGTAGGFHGGIRFFTSSNAVIPKLAMIVDRNQNVGIGLTNSSNLTASARLHLIGSGNTSATSSLLVQNNAGTYGIQILDSISVGVNSTLQTCFNTGGAADVNSGVRILATTSGQSFIDGYSEGPNKANNYPIIIGARVNNTGSSRTGTSTAENGSQVFFGSEIIVASAQVGINSTTRGFLPPRMTTTQRDAIVSPATGLRIYNTTTNTNDTYNGTVWQSNSVSGVSGAIQFSNGSAFASDAANLFWDDTNNRLGVGTNAPTSPLSISSTSSSIFDWSRVSGSTGYLAVTNIRSGAGQGTVFGVDQFSFRNSSAVNYIVSEGNRLGIGTNNDALTSQLQIKGSGSTSATTSLLVQNSGGATLMSVRDDGAINIGAGGLTTFTGTVTNTTGPMQGLNFATSSSPFNFGTASIYNITGTASAVTSGQRDGFLGQFTFAPTSGTAVLNVLNVSPTINQTGGANGITRGLYINPTLTAAADFRAIQTTAGKIIFGGLPTSSAGLVSGQLWNDAGTLKIA